MAHSETGPHGHGFIIIIQVKCMSKISYKVWKEIWGIQIAVAV